MRELLTRPLLTAVPQEVWRKCPPENFDERPAKTIIDRLIIHSDGSTNIAECINAITNPSFHRSYHVSFGVEGACYRHVDFNKRAWHALKNNAGTIGVNLSNPQDGHHPHPLAQLDAAAAYIAWVILPQYPAITPAKILTHWLIDPDRKADPYPHEPTYDHDVFKARIEQYRHAPKPA